MKTPWGSSILGTGPFSKFLGQLRGGQKKNFEPSGYLKNYQSDQSSCQRDILGWKILALTLLSLQTHSGSMDQQRGQSAVPGLRTCGVITESQMIGETVPGGADPPKEQTPEAPPSPRLPHLTVSSSEGVPTGGTSGPHSPRFVCSPAQALSSSQAASHARL